MRLSARTLPQLPAHVARPDYDRDRLATGIVHLGLGAFHRAQEAVFTEAAISAGDLRWGILGACLRSPVTRDALAPQDWLYTVAERSDGSEHLRVIGALRGVLVAPEKPEALLAAMSHPAVAIVSLTVTEKGYGLDPASGTLDTGQADIRHDLANPMRPRSAPGYLVEALGRRRAAGHRPFTVLCCDNLARNGEAVRRAVVELATLRDTALGHHIADTVAFPSTMLDRIVPATTDADRRHIAERIGLEDASPVIAEAYNRWIVEDRFPAGRPQWEAVGVELVSDIAPYEALKLQLLNASHSALAYLGYLAGHETIADACHDAVFRDFINVMMDEEIIPTLALPAGIDAHAYKRSVMARFANRAIRHRTWQIAMDGSQKLPPRLLRTIRTRLADGAPFARLALAVAGWMRYVSGTDEQGRPIDVRDPLAARLNAIAAAAGPVPERLAPALLALPEVFGNDLPREPHFVEPVTRWLARLYAVGARGATAEALSGA
ncbi:MAG TPA: mannitol dehydrogenase family protein [Xanthobacteraceae bacterium]|nr:mannitol dehydrogenase family protein [Xanthobacteraceae bacterium]